MTVIEQAEHLRTYIEKAMQSLPDSEALQAKTLYPLWDDLVETGTTALKEGFRFQYCGKLYRTEQPEYTFVSHYVPGSTGTESLFSVVDETHAGTLEDPIPYETNMEIFEGKYYIQYGVVYICTRSSGQPLYHDLSALVGHYVEEIA